MSRVILVAAVAASASALLAFAPVAALRKTQVAPVPADPKARPSVLLLLVEDAPASMAAGPRRVPTPHLDRLAARGRRFDSAYTQYPLSSASRMSLMTGWRPERTGVWGDPDGRVEGATVLQEHFAASGYYTARVGPVFRGAGEKDMRWDEAEERRPNGSPAARAAAVVTRARLPFFVAVSLGGGAPALSAGVAGPSDGAGELPAIAVGPLEPLARPHAVLRPRRLTEAEGNARLAAEDARLIAIDAQVGTVLAALERRGLAERTIVVLAGDAGTVGGGHGAVASADLLFEETLRVPLVMSGPGVSAPGSASSGLVELVDLYPTLLGMCALPPVEGLDGRSLAPMLADPAHAGHESAFSAVARAAGQIGRSLRTARHRYTEWPDGSEELYDHDADPRELTNLAARPEQAATVAELRRLLAAREKAGPPRTPAGAAAPPGRRLNVLLILVDDLNVHVGAYGENVRTPNIDRLAARGRRFDRAYAQVAMCSPSRSSLLSGWRPERTDIWNNLTPVRQHLNGARPLQEHFRAQGYFAGRVGKIYEGAMSDQFDWDSDDELVAPSAEARHDDESVRGAWWVPTSNDDAHEPDGERARRLARLIEEHRDRPFFLAAGFSKPHLKWVAPRRYFDMYPPDSIRVLPQPADDLADIPAIAIKNRPQERPGVPLAGREPPGLIDDPRFRREATAAYHASVSFVDAQVGVLLDTLDRLKLWESTVVVLLGDHGFHLGEHRGLWRKDTLFEEAVRTPLIVAAPQVQRPGEAAAAEVELLDLYPTIVELAGVPRVAGVDGTSLAPLLRDPSQRIRTGALSFRRAKAPLLGVSVRTARYRYTQWPDGSEELYDHGSDPGETRNLARDPGAAAPLSQMRALRAAGPSGSAAPQDKGE